MATASDNDCDDEGHEEKPSSSIMRLMDPPKRNPHPVKREHSQAWLLEYDLNSQSEQKTDSLEVFFAGSHADVGGGSGEPVSSSATFEYSYDCSRKQRQAQSSSVMVCQLRTAVC